MLEHAERLVHLHNFCLPLQRPVFHSNFVSLIVKSQHKTQNQDDEQASSRRSPGKYLPLSTARLRFQDPEEGDREEVKRSRTGIAETMDTEANLPPVSSPAAQPLESSVDLYASTGKPLLTKTHRITYSSGGFR